MRSRMLIALVLAGCAWPEPPPVGPALAAWARAASADDPRAAYRLLSRDTRARVGEAEFAAAWRASAAERASQARAIHTAATAGAWQTVADVAIADRTTRLVREPDGWRLLTPKSTPRGADSPAAALRALADALEARDADALLHLLADPLRSLIERELAARVARLRAAGGRPIPVDGEHARIPLDERYHIDLVRENGQWRVADLN